MFEGSFKARSFGWSFASDQHLADHLERGVGGDHQGALGGNVQSCSKVSRQFHKCFKDDSSKFQGCFKKV